MINSGAGYGYGAGHGYGYRALEKALNEFALANRDFWMYAESKLTEPLSVEFWEAQLTDFLEE